MIPIDVILGVAAVAIGVLGVLTPVYIWIENGRSKKRQVLHEKCARLETRVDTLASDVAAYKLTAAEEFARERHLTKLEERIGNSLAELRGDLGNLRKDMSAQFGKVMDAVKAS